MSGQCERPGPVTIPRTNTESSEDQSSDLDHDETVAASDGQPNMSDQPR